MTGTDCLQFTHKKSRSYLNHLVIFRSVSTYKTLIFRGSPLSKNTAAHNCTFFLAQACYSSDRMTSKQMKVYDAVMTDVLRIVFVN